MNVSVCAYDVRACERGTFPTYIAETSAFPRFRYDEIFNVGLCRLFTATVSDEPLIYGRFEYFNTVAKRHDNQSDQFSSFNVKIDILISDSLNEISFKWMIIS